MAKVKIQGHASGTGVVTVTAPNTSTDRTITLPDATCTLADNSDVTTKLPLAGGTMTGTTVHGDNVKDTYGASADLEIFHDGSHSRIKDVGTGYLVLSGTEIHLNDASNSNNRIKIDSTGAVTMPAQPAFSAQPSSDQTNIALENLVDVAMGTERFDVGADFANSTFTAPVTGKYGLGYNLRLEYCDTAASYLYVQITTSNHSYRTIRTLKLTADPTYWNANLFVVADMDASDTAKVQVLQSGGTAQMDIQTSQSNFYGYLLG